MPTQLKISQLSLGPDIPLGRRGCLLENGKKSYSKEFYNGTPLENHIQSAGVTTWFYCQTLLKEKFPDILSICRKSHLKDFISVQQADVELLKNLIQWKILSDDYKLIPRIESFGNLFECIVGLALNENHMQNIRKQRLNTHFLGSPMTLMDSYTMYLLHLTFQSFF